MMTDKTKYAQQLSNRGESEEGRGGGGSESIPVVCLEVVLYSIVLSCMGL